MKKLRYLVVRVLWLGGFI